MMRVNVHLSNDRFPELVNRTLMGERIIIEQEGKAAAAIITYVDLQRIWGFWGFYLFDFSQHQVRTLFFFVQKIGKTPTMKL